VARGGVRVRPAAFESRLPALQLRLARRGVRSERLPLAPAEVVPFAVTAAKLFLTNDRHAADGCLSDLATCSAPRMEKKQMMGNRPVAVIDTRGLSQMKTLAIRLARNFIIERRAKITGGRSPG
jgi:hypothetical protein